MQDSHWFTLLKRPIIIPAPLFDVGDLVISVVTPCCASPFKFSVLLLFSFFLTASEGALPLPYSTSSHPFNLFSVPFPGVCPAVSVFSCLCALVRPINTLSTCLKKQQTSKQESTSLGFAASSDDHLPGFLSRVNLFAAGPLENWLTPHGFTEVVFSEATHKL